jgi:cytochrome c oxidase subunit 2
MKLRFIASFVFAIMLITALSVLHAAHAQNSPTRIEIIAKRFDFTPADITVRRGQPVVLALKSVDAAHGLRFTELGIEVKVDKGQIGQIAFTPDKIGDFVGQCSVFCGSGHGRMKLTLHVE